MSPGDRKRMQICAVLLLLLALLADVGVRGEEAPKVQLRPAAVFEIDRKFYIQNLANGNLVPLQVPGLNSILSVATGNVPLAFGMSAGNLRLLKMNGDKWQPLPLPKGNYGNDLQILADGDNIILRDSSRIFWFNGKSWRQIPSKANGEVAEAARRAKRSSYALKAPYLYRGLDGGEWAGGVIALNMQTGYWERVRCSTAPVTELRRDPGGDIWATQGNFDGLIAEGVLSKISSPGSTQLISKISGVPLARPSARAKNSGVNWSYGPAVFCSVDFDESGTPYLLVDSLGVLKNGLAGWQILTPSWVPGPMRPKSLVLMPGAKRAVVSENPSGMKIIELSN